MAQDVAALDFGSGKITVLIGHRGVNNTITINGLGESEYAGYANGEFYQPEQLSYAIAHAISNAETNSQTKITHLYVGVPSDFSSIMCKEVSISFGKRRRVKDTDVAELHEQGMAFDDKVYTLVNCQPVYYSLDDGRRLIEPVGLSTSKLSGCISYVLAESRFIMNVNAIMSSLGIESVEYMSNTLSESLFLFDTVTRDRFAVLMDVGFITTTVAVVRGDGILSQHSFALGGGNITGDLAMHYSIPFSTAEALKRKVVLSLDHADGDVYEVVGRNETLKFSAKEVNNIVTARIAVIAKTIEKCLKMCEYEYPDSISYSLTGGGISYMRGAKEILSKLLNRKVEIVAPKLPQLDSPHWSSSLGLIDMAINSMRPQKKKSFLAKLLGK